MALRRSAGQGTEVSHSMPVIKPIDMEKVQQLRGEPSPLRGTSSESGSSWRRLFKGGSKRNLRDESPPSPSLPSTNLPPCLSDYEGEFYQEYCRRIREREHLYTEEVLEAYIWGRIEREYIPLLREKCKAKEFDAALKFEVGSPRTQTIMRDLQDTDQIRQGLIGQWSFLRQFIRQYSWEEADRPWAEGFVAKLDTIVERGRGPLAEMQLAARILFEEVLHPVEKVLVAELFRGEEQFKRITSITNESADRLVRKLMSDAFDMVTMQYCLERGGGFSEETDLPEEPLNHISWEDLRKGLYREGGPIFQRVEIGGAYESVVEASKTTEAEYLREVIFRLLKAGLYSDEEFGEFEQKAQNRILMTEARRLHEAIVSGVSREKETVMHVMAALTINAWAWFTFSLKALNPNTNEHRRELYSTGDPLLSPKTRRALGYEENLHLDTRELHPSTESERAITSVIRVKVNGPWSFSVTKEQLLQICELPKGIDSFRIGPRWATLRREMTIEAVMTPGEGGVPSKINWKRSDRLVEVRFEQNLSREHRRMLIARLEKDLANRDELERLFREKHPGVHRAAEETSSDGPSAKAESPEIEQSPRKKKPKEKKSRRK
ncbi:MAG: hypothetical protein KDK48_04910 [Chlamydiia bacterium]|nr:hypothetical protein [Chlamydiia bacterium]